jgi:hypothetical protein
MSRLSDQILTPVNATPTTKKGRRFAPVTPGHDAAAANTYNYLRLGMLVAVGALAYSIMAERQYNGVHCFLGSISGYYYTPVHPVFIGVMIAVGFALIAIKGRTALEDMSLSLAGMMAPIVALIPTSDDVNGVCRPQMLAVGHYQAPIAGSIYPRASITNNLHTLVFAGFTALVLVIVPFFVQWWRTGATTQYTTGFWINWSVGGALVILALILIHFCYNWVLMGHAYAACAMFAFLAGAAIANLIAGHNVDRKYAVTYGIIGVLMLGSGVAFVLVQGKYSSGLNGHLVLAIEAAEIILFAVYWAIQTIERWNQPV